MKKRIFNNPLNSIEKMKTKRDREMEDEANVFACLLLMPKECIEKDLEDGLDLGDNKAFDQLAKKYQVPLNALLFRIALLYKRKI